MKVAFEVDGRLPPLRPGLPHPACEIIHSFGKFLHPDEVVTFAGMFNAVSLCQRSTL